MPTALEYLTNGSVLKAVNTLYTTATNGWFWFIVYMFTILIMIHRTKSEGAVLTVTLIGSALLIRWGYLPIGIQFVLYTFAVLSLAMLLWKFFGRGE